MRNIGFGEFTWSDADQLLGGAATTTVEQLRLAAESVGAYTSVARIRGNRVGRVARLASPGQRVSMLVYHEPSYQYGTGHFACVPWVGSDKLFYIDPASGGSVNDLALINQTQESLCLFVSNTPLSMGRLESSRLEAILSFSAVIGVVGVGMVIGAVTIAVRSRRSARLQTAG